MSTWARRALAAVMAGAAGTTLVVTACSAPPVDVGGGAAPAPTTTSQAADPAPPGGPSPNAPEVNPAGDIPDNQVFVAYSPPGAGFSVRVPEGWARTAGGATTTFTDKFNSVAMSAQPRPAAPTVGSEQPTAPAGSAARVSQVTRTAGPVILITYAGVSPADPVTGKTVRTAVERYEFWRNGRLAVLTLTAPQGADNVDPWRIVTDSFTWTA